MGDVIWKPDEFRADASLLGQFMVHLGSAVDQPFA